MAHEPEPVSRKDGLHSKQDKLSASLLSVTYSSRALAPMSEMELHRLARAAQQRNGIEGVTGLLVYDSGWIYQQIEGPSDGMGRVWESIRQDRRHASIKVLSDGPADKRCFQDWGMRLAVRGAMAGLSQHRSMADEQPESIRRLCRGESPSDVFEDSWPAVLARPAPLSQMSESLVVPKDVLSKVVSTIIVPRLCALHSVSEGAPKGLSAVLARLLTAVDSGAALALVRAALSQYPSLGGLVTKLLEPAARGLGDLWQSDDCTELEVALGLARLQAIARDFSLSAPRATVLHPPVVLVAPQPGELHLLGAALDAEMLWQAGWSPRVDFPSSNSELDSLVASTWIDALDLSLSTAFSRDHRLEQVTKTIASARLASLNPHLIVVVSGRIFSDVAKPDAPTAASLGVGADGTFGSASHAQTAILHALTGVRGDPVAGKTEQPSEIPKRVLFG